MSRRFRIVSIAAAALMLAMWFSPVPASSQPAKLPHENPAEAVESLDAVYLLLFYAGVLGQASERQYDAASASLAYLKRADIPSELRSIINRYTALTSQLIGNLNNVERLLSEASLSITQGETDTARQKLGEAESLLADCQFLLRDIDLSTGILVERIGTAGSAARRRAQETYQRLGGILARLQRLLNELTRSREQLADNPAPANSVVQTVRAAARFYYSTDVELSAPRDALPGALISISGAVRSGGGDIAREVSLLFDGATVAAGRYSNVFSFEVRIPADIVEGRHSIAVQVPPAQDRAGASRAVDIRVSRIPIVLKAAFPSVSLSPAITVQGSVMAQDKPLPGARVAVVYGASEVTAVADELGGFTARLSAPFDPLAAGPQRYTVQVIPPLYEYRGAVATHSVFLLNPLSAAGTLMAVAAAMLFIMRRRPKQSASLVSLPGERNAARDPTSTPLTPQPDTAVPTGLIAAYRTAVRAVTGVTGKPPAPGDTLREYARFVAAVATGARPFLDLTAIVEAGLYSGREVDTSMVHRAQSLAHQLEEYYRGAA